MLQAALGAQAITSQQLYVLHAGKLVMRILSRLARHVMPKLVT
jgi:hypothetical protein